MKKVFVSFSSNDHSLAVKVVERLENSGIPCFICDRDIQKGHDYPAALVEAIEECDYFALLASPSSDRSEHVRSELQLAFDRKKTIIPFKIVDFELSETLNYYLARKQFINAYEMSDDASLDMLVDTIRKDLDSKVIEKIGNTALPNSDKGKDFSREEIAEDLIEKNRKYTYSLYKSLYKKSEENRRKYIESCNKFYKKAFTLFNRGKEVETDDIVGEIIEKAESSASENIFNFFAPSGSGKNHLMQSVFFRMMDRFVKGESDILPIYVPFAFFSRHCNVESISKAEGVMYSLLRQEYLEAINYCSNHEEVTAFVLYDSLRDYTISAVPPEKAAPQVFGALPDIKVGAAIDTGLCRNQMRAKAGYACISSSPQLIIEKKRIFVYDKQQSMDYLEAACELYDYSADPIEIYELAKEKGFTWLDPCIIELVIDCLDDRSKNVTISDIYENKVESMLNNDYKLVKSIAKKTYEFVSTNYDFDDEYGNNEWMVLAKHNTFLDFLLGYNLRLVLEEYDETHNAEPIIRFYPKLVVDFLDGYLEKSPALQRSIVKIIMDHYQEETDAGRARLIFWGAYIHNENLKNELSEFVLSELKRVIPLVENSFADGDDGSEGTRSLLILYRTLISTALEMGKNGYIEQFLTNLLLSDQANSMNKGFLLYYYGDKKADYTEKSIHFADNRDLGFRAINRLNINLQQELMVDKSNRPVELFLFSFFSLLQTRIEFGSPDLDYVDLKKMCQNAIDYYKAYKKKQSVLMSNREIKAYFDGISQDFKHYVESGEKLNVACNVLNPMLNPNLTPRANWEHVKTSRVETVAEHLYGAYLIGLILLPQKDSSQEGYNKNKILSMLLLHDLGEIEVGDHPILASEQEKMFYDNQEDNAIRIILQRGSYSTVSNLSKSYELWNSFQNKMDINAKIAQDIDAIHTTYRFALYYKESKDNFSQEEIDAFLDHRDEIITEIGWKIYYSVVRDNPIFAEIKKELEL